MSYFLWYVKHSYVELQTRHMLSSTPLNAVT